MCQGQLGTTGSQVSQIGLGFEPFFKFILLKSDVYSLCVAYPEPLADRLYAETKKFLEEHVAATLVKVKAGGEQNLLANYHETWKEFSRGIDYLHMLYSYLNNQHIRKQKISEAELNYGCLVIDHAETMKEIGELGLDIWRRQMVEPLKEELVRLLLDGIRYDRLGSESISTGRTQFQTDATLKGVISSFVEVEEYKKKGNLDVSCEINPGYKLKINIYTFGFSCMKRSLNRLS